MAALGEQQEVILHAGHVATLRVDQFTLETDLLLLPAELFTLLQVFCGIIINGRSSCRAGSQQMHLGTVRPHLEAGSETGAGFREIAPLEGLYRHLVIMPRRDLPAGNGGPRADDRYQ